MGKYKNRLRKIVEIFPEMPQLFIKRLFAKTIFEGPAAGLRICSFGTPGGYISGTYEKPVQNELTRLLCPGDVFYDIGANFGFFSILAARLVQNTGQVYSFEPVPKNIDMIRRHVRLNRLHNIKIFGQAVSDTEGNQEIWITRHPGGATLTSTGTVPPDKISKLTVATVAIDSLIDKAELKPPSLIKIDVEGAELPVLRGMSATLQKYSPVLIYEIDDCDERSFNNKIDQTLSFFKAFDYDVSRIKDSYPARGWHVAHFVAEPCH